MLKKEKHGLMAELVLERKTYTVRCLYVSNTSHQDEHVIVPFLSEVHHVGLSDSTRTYNGVEIELPQVLIKTAVLKSEIKLTLFKNLGENLPCYRVLILDILLAYYDTNCIFSNLNERVVCPEQFLKLPEV